MKKEIFLSISAISIEFFGWGFSDSFFTIFLDGILQNTFFVGALIALRNFVALLVAIFSSEKMRNFSAKNFLILSKILFSISAAAFFAAGFFENKILIFAGIIFGGIAQPMRNVAHSAFLIAHCDRENSSKIFGVDLAGKYFAWILGMIFSGFLLIFCGKILSQNLNEILHFSFLPIFPMLFLSLKIIKKLPSQQNLHFQKFSKIIFADHIFSKFFRGFDKFSPQLSFSLILFFLLQIMERMTMFFVPLLAVKLNLPFWQIGILTAFFFAPYIFSFIFGKIADAFDRFSVIVCGLFFSIFPFALLSVAQTPILIGILASLIAFCLALIQPANLGIVASLAGKKQRAHLAGLEIFFQKAGNIFGALFFGFIAQKFSLEIVFVIIAALISIFTILAIFVKINARFLKIPQKITK